MKKVFNSTRSTIVTSVIGAMLAISAGPIFAAGTHSHSHDNDKPTFEATNEAFGSYQPDMQESKTIEVTMDDNFRFSPDVINVSKGDVVKFVHTNTGAITHEFVLGTEESLAEHAKLMQKFPNMEHEEPYMLHVAAGASGSLLWKFSQAGEFGFACLVPGHYEAGMKGKVVVQ